MTLQSLTVASPLCVLLGGPRPAFRREPQRAALLQARPTPRAPVEGEAVAPCNASDVEVGALVSEGLLR